jgi:GNAT superfamily N-acetyltransferase
VTATDEPRTAGDRPPLALTYRPARPDELAICADIWRVSINDYIRPLGQVEVPPEQAPLLRLYAHLQATDPDRFVVGVTPDPDQASGERVVAFAAAVVRERLWFLSMCFVLPEAQGRGVGRGLLEAAGAPPGSDVVRATATDSAQPISNALYASLGIVPRVPLLDLIGHPMQPDAFGELPAGIRPIQFEELVGGGPGGEGHGRLSAAVDALDRATLGVAHPHDHRYLRQEGRRGWLYHGPDGSPVAYGYATEAGRVGPVAALDADLVTPILGHLTRAVIPRGAFAMWLPGTADRAVVAALRAGFRLDQFPILLCWDQPFADLARYLPISPGLL